MRTLLPSRLATTPLRRKGLSRGILTLARTKRACSDEKALLSISITFPCSLPISLLASSDIKSKGKPYTWTQIGIELKVTELVVIPLSHLCNTRRWFSKPQRPLWMTHFSWLSSANLNCNKPSPTSTIFRSAPNFHSERISDLVALRLYGRVVRKRPSKLSEQASSILSLCVLPTLITSLSSSVRVIFYTLSIKFESILLGKSFGCLEQKKEREKIIIKIYGSSRSQAHL